MLLDVNAQSRIIWLRSQKSRIPRVRSATTGRGILEAYSSQKPQFAMVGCQCERVHQIMRMEMLYSVRPFSLRFLRRSHQNEEIWS